MEKNDYSKFDHKIITQFLFYPRKDSDHSGSTVNAKSILIPVEDNVVIGANFFIHHEKSPTILFLHGNGEIVSDYNDLGEMFIQQGINFFPVDYRGYGKSTGVPTVSAMMKDSHIIYKFIKKWLSDNNFSGPLVVMGRSLGSASALELVSVYKEDIDAVIIESGFAYAVPLLKLLGINAGQLGITEDDGFKNIDKIKKFNKPVLIIHAERDHIIPFSDGQALYDASISSKKELIKIPKANHNNIFQYGFKEYMEGIKKILGNL